MGIRLENTIKVIALFAMAFWLWLDGHSFGWGEIAFISLIALLWIWTLIGPRNENP